MGVIGDLLAVVTPVFICVAIGLLWGKLDKPFDTDIITSLVYNVGAPCLIIATFAKVKISGAALVELTLAGLLCYAAFAVIGALVLMAARLKIADYLPSLMFPLTGSMGLPVCLFAMGEPGLALALVYFMLGTLGTFTVGAAIAAGRVSFKEIVRTPAVYAVFVAVYMVVAEVQTPQWIVNTTALLGGTVIPMQLIALGRSLMQLRFAGVGRSTALGLLRLGMGVAVGWGVAAALGLTGAARAVVILQSAMPVAVSSYLFAQLYGRKPEEVAGMVLISTVVSFLTLPVLLYFVLHAG
jgi:predicted permease